MATKVYSYGAKSPLPECIGHVNEQMLLAHRYYNSLIEVTRSRLAAGTEIYNETVALSNIDAIKKRLSECELAITSTRAAINEAKVATRTKNPPAGLADLAKRQVAEKKAIAAELKAARAEAKAKSAEYKQKMRPLDEQFAAAKKRLYNEASGLYWGTKLDVCQRSEAALKAWFKSRKEGNVTDEKGPKFRRWRRKNVLAVQIQSGISAEEAKSGKDTRVKIEKIDGKKKLHLVHMRLGTAEDGSPIVVTVPTYIHREIPATAEIMWVKLVRTQVDEHRMSDGRYVPNDQWKVQFTLRLPDENTGVPIGKVAGIDVGWATHLEGSIRVAVLRDTDGNTTHFKLPANVASRYGKSSAINSDRTTAFNAAIDVLSEYVRTAHDLPEFLCDVKPHLHLWKSESRLARLVDSWVRHEGDADVFAVVKAWRDRDAHLNQYERNNVKRAELIRLDLYRNIAAKLKKSYSHIVIEDLNLAEMRENAKPEGKPNRASTSGRNPAAVGVFLSCLKAAFGERLVKVDPAGTSKIHAACGSVETLDGRPRSHTCSRCGVTYDRDENAAENILRRGIEQLRDAEKAAVARQTDGVVRQQDAEVPVKFVGRWQKRKEARSKKEMEGGDKDVT